ncbi:hypothetical protein BH20ACT6_BH20ACT6_25080 [soil metagenome]
MPEKGHGRPAWVAPTVVAAIFLATVAQLLLATLAPELPQSRGKAFGTRLVAYPLLMALLPVAWTVLGRRRDGPLPWVGFGLLMLPFLVDVTGNTLDLYDTIGWWDDANHLVNWFLLCCGAGVLLALRLAPAWALGVVVAGIGALLAVGWELAEWFFFIRHGTEIDTAYEDTLGDQSLGTLGGVLAAIVIVRLRRRGTTVDGRG